MVDRFRSRILSWVDRTTQQLRQKTQSLLRRLMGRSVGVAEVLVYPIYRVAQIGRHVIQQLLTNPSIAPNSPDLAANIVETSASIRSTLKFIHRFIEPRSLRLPCTELLQGIASDYLTQELQLVFENNRTYKPSDSDQLLLQHWLEWERTRILLSQELAPYRHQWPAGMSSTWQNRLTSLKYYIHTTFQTIRSRFAEQLFNIVQKSGIPLDLTPPLSVPKTLRPRRVILTNSDHYPFTFLPPIAQDQLIPPHNQNIIKISKKTAREPHLLPPEILQSDRLPELPDDSLKWYAHQQPTLQNRDLQAVEAVSQASFIQNPLSESALEILEFQTRYPQYAPNWIDVDATVVEYVQSPLMWILSRLDAVFYGIEQWIGWGFSWVRAAFKVLFGF